VKQESFARTLIEWYVSRRRDLPWRRTTDPYRIWVSEIMLQQTRVEAVLPYYERFLSKYPDLETLARAHEQELLAMWAGLGYYSRARNMHRAAKQIVQAGSGFPNTYDEIRAMSGVGDYTAAAIASISFGLPHAVLDGNVMRVMSRITDDPGDIRSAETRRRLQGTADELLDASDPAAYNQGLMELGATICVPLQPKCLFCPVQSYCAARKSGRERELPIKSNSQNRKWENIDLFIVQKNSTILLHQRPPESKRLAGFWELPDRELIPSATIKGSIGAFQHGITNTTYTVSVYIAEIRRKPTDLLWIEIEQLSGLPLSTAARKALQLWDASVVKSL
jgi:A/G-specific adenine glycosylase